MPTLPKRVRPCCLPKYPQWMQQQYMMGSSPADHRHDKSDDYRRSSMSNITSGRPPLLVSMREAEQANRAAELSTSAIFTQYNADTNPLYNHQRNGRPYGGGKDSGSTLLLKQAIANRIATENQLKRDISKSGRGNNEETHLGRQVGCISDGRFNIGGTQIQRQSASGTMEKNKKLITDADDEMQRSIMMNSAWYRDNEGRTGYKPKDWSDQKMPQQSQVKELCGIITKSSVNITTSKKDLKPVIHEPITASTEISLHLNEKHVGKNSSLTSFESTKNNLRMENEIGDEQNSSADGTKILTEDDLTSSHQKIKHSKNSLSDEGIQKNKVLSEKIRLEDFSSDSMSYSPEIDSISEMNKVRKLSTESNDFSDDQSSIKIIVPQSKRPIDSDSLKFSMQSHKSVTFSEMVEVNEIENTADDQAEEGFSNEGTKENHEDFDYSPSITPPSDEYSNDEELVPAGLMDSLNLMYNQNALIIDDYTLPRKESADENSIINQIDVLQGSDELLSTFSNSYTDTLRNLSEESTSSSNYSFQDLLDKGGYTESGSESTQCQSSIIQQDMNINKLDLESSYYDNVSEGSIGASIELTSHAEETLQRAYTPSKRCLITVGVQTDSGPTPISGDSSGSDSSNKKYQYPQKNDGSPSKDIKPREEYLKERFLSKFASSRVPKANLDSDGEEYPIDPNHRRKDSDVSTLSRESVISATSLRKEKLVSRNFNY